MTHRSRPVTLVVGLMSALLLLVGGAAPRAHAAAPPVSPTSDPILQRLLDTLVAKGASGALAVVDDGQHTWRQASGFARIHPRQRMRPDARFRIGSVTKTFVAAAALQLVEDGKLGLDDTVERWLPGLVPNGKAITLRMLLNHTSGLYNYSNDPSFARSVRQRPTRSMPPRQLVAIATVHAPEFSPGARWAYSNTGYIVAGLMLEAASGQRIERLIRQRIVQPLGLTGTTFPTDSRIGGYYAHGYLPTSATSTRFRDVSRFSPSIAWTAGGMISTAGDLRRFYAALLGGRLLPARRLAEMEATVATAVPGMGYGLGLMAQRTPCGTGWGHIGRLPGYVTFAYSSRTGQKGVVLMMSTSPDAALAPFLLTALAVAGCRASGGIPTGGVAAVPPAFGARLPNAGSLIPAG